MRCNLTTQVCFSIISKSLLNIKMKSHINLFHTIAQRLKICIKRLVVNVQRAYMTSDILLYCFKWQKLVMLKGALVACKMGFHCMALKHGLKVTQGHWKWFNFVIVLTVLFQYVVDCVQISNVGLWAYKKTLVLWSYMIVHIRYWLPKLMLPESKFHNLKL